MRISDWSSDVCSSDLAGARGRTGVAGVPVRAAAVAGVLPRADRAAGAGHACGGGPAPRRRPGHRAPVVDHCPAAPLLAADAGNLAAAVTAVVGAVRAAPAQAGDAHAGAPARSEEHTSELQSLMRISYAVFC